MNCELKNKIQIDDYMIKQFNSKQIADYTIKQITD